MAYKLEPPASAANAVVFISAGIKINAPAVHVFDILIETGRWSEWNSFIPSVDLEKPKGSPDSSETLSTGTKMSMKIRMKPGANLMTQKMVVTELERPVPNERGHSGNVHRVCWKFTGLPEFMLRTGRTNDIIEEGEASCEYRTTEIQSGPSAYAVKSMYGETLQMRFEDMANDLKAYAEQTWAQNAGTT